MTALAAAAALEGVQSARPGTHRLIGAVLRAAGVPVTAGGGTGAAREVYA